MRPWLAALLCLPLLAEAGLLEPFVSTYEVSLRGVAVGQLKRELSYPAPGQYRFVSRLESTGLVNLLRKTWTEELSAGAIDAKGLSPADYLETKVSGRKRRESKVEFRPEEGRIVQSHKGATHESPLESGILDKLAYQLALMRDLDQATRRLSYRVADDGKVKHYTLSVEGTESIRLADGEVSALRVVHAREGSGRRTTLWCAPSLGNLPVKIEYLERDGARIIALLRR
ncbi:MAG: hypothetical protein RL434_2499 [Pseudomonadota bacterium]|jgi:hypothetical protein